MPAKKQQLLGKLLLQSCSRIVWVDEPYRKFRNDTVAVNKAINFSVSWADNMGAKG